MANKIIIFIDGQQVTYLNKSTSTKFLADEDAKLVKVMLESDDGFSLLATLLLNRKEIEKYLAYRLWRGKKQYYAKQENGDELIFHLGLKQNNFTIEIKYQQKRELKSIRQWLSYIIHIPRLLALPSYLTIIITIIIALLPIGYYVFSPLAISPDVKKKPLPSPIDKQPQEVITVNPSISKEKPTTPHIAGNTPKPKERNDINERTMSIHSALDLELSRIKNIYIELPEKTSRSAQLEELLSEKIKTIGFTITSEKNTADAILIGKIDNHTISIKLINGRGKTLFANDFNSDKDLSYTVNQISLLLAKAKSSNRQK